jgi:putative IMPACT (imprinted ancient) family translation regulator
VRAYTEAAQQALQALPLAERVARRRGVLELPYALYEPVKRLVAAQGGDVAEETFAAAVTLTLVFPEDAVPGFEAALRETSGGRLAVRWEPGITEG